MSNYESYADVLESYMIAEEGIIGSAVKGAVSGLVTVVMKAINTLIKTIRKISEKMQSSIGKTIDKVDDITGKKKREAGDKFFKVVKTEVTNVTSEMAKHLGAFGQEFMNKNGYYKGYARIEKFDEYTDNMDSEYHDYESGYGAYYADVQISFSRKNKQEAAALLKNINGALTRTKSLIDSYKNMTSPSSTTFCKELQAHVLTALHASAKYLNFIADH